MCLLACYWCAAITVCCKQKRLTRRELSTIYLYYYYYLLLAHREFGTICVRQLAAVAEPLLLQQQRAAR